MTINEGAAAMQPPVSSRTLTYLLRDVAPIGRRYGRAGRRANVYAVADILRVHAAWVLAQG